MEKKTKILYVVTKSNFGGAQKYVFDLATRIPKNRFDVVVATGGSGLLINKLQEQNIRVISIPSLVRDVNSWKDFLSFFELFSIFLKENPDVVHLNSAKAGGISAFVARIARVPNIIFTAHGWAFNEERPHWQRVLIKFFSWLTVIFSHKTIAVSEAVNRDTKNWPLIRNKVVTIHNGISSSDFLTKENARKALFDNMEIPLDSFVIGTNAELHKNKGLSYAIEAMQQLKITNKNIYYIIISDGEEKESLQNLINASGLQKHIFLLGYIPDAALFLPAFDIFLLPSIKEGLPYVLLEAGSAGLPVIATEVGGIPEIIENGKTGILVPSRDPDAIAEAVNRLISSPPLRDTLGHALYEKVATQFSQKTMLDMTISLYEKK